MNTTPPNINASTKSIDFMQNISPSSYHPIIELGKIKISKTGFKKLSILLKFLKWRIWQERSSCLHNYDALCMKIDIWLTPYAKLLKQTIIKPFLLFATMVYGNKKLLILILINLFFNISQKLNIHLSKCFYLHFNQNFSKPILYNAAKTSSNHNLH